MQSTEDIYAEARSEVEATLRADLPNRRPRHASETEEHYQARSESWIANSMPSSLRDVMASKLEAATEKVKAEQAAAVAEVQAAHFRREREREAATAQAARDAARAQAHRDEALAVLTDAARRDVPVARSKDAARIYAEAGFEYVDAIGPMPKLIPVEQ